MSNFIHDINFDFSPEIFDRMFGRFKAFRFDCSKFKPSYFTSNSSFDNILNIQSPRLMVPSVFTYNATNFRTFNTIMNSQSFNYSVPQIQYSSNGIGDSLIKTGMVEKSKTNMRTSSPTASLDWIDFKRKHSVKTMEINGQEIYACGWTSFKHSPKEWLDLQSCLIESANELGLTLVYSDVCRSKSASDAARAQKGTVVAKGGNSPHNFGVGADIVLYNKDGKAVSTQSQLYKIFATKVKEKSGGKITWGGDWGKDANGNLIKDKTRTINGRTLHVSVAEAHHFEFKGWQALRDNGTLTCIA